MQYAYSKTHGLILGQVIEVFDNKVRVDRSWRYGKDKAETNIVYLEDVNLLEDHENVENDMQDCLRIWKDKVKVED